MNMKSRFIRSSKSSITCFEALLKSINIYDEYSFSANSHTKVDLPTRLAPSIRIAVLPFLWIFHWSSLSYNFRLNILFIFILFIMR